MNMLHNMKQWCALTFFNSHTLEAHNCKTIKSKLIRGTCIEKFPKKIYVNVFPQLLYKVSAHKQSALYCRFNYY